MLTTLIVIGVAVVIIALVVRSLSRSGNSSLSDGSVTQRQEVLHSTRSDSQTTGMSSQPRSTAQPRQAPQTRTVVRDTHYHNTINPSADLLNPLNPISPISPLNPINMMDSTYYGNDVPAEDNKSCDTGSGYTSGSSYDTSSCDDSSSRNSSSYDTGSNYSSGSSGSSYDSGSSSSGSDW